MQAFFCMQNFVNAEEKSIQDTIGVNIPSLIYRIHKILPLMLNKKSPSRIVNIAQQTVVLLCHI